MYDLVGETDPSVCFHYIVECWMPCERDGVAGGAVSVVALKVIFSVLYKDSNEEEILKRQKKQAGRLVTK